MALPHMLRSLLFAHEKSWGGEGLVGFLEKRAQLRSEKKNPLDQTFILLGEVLRIFFKAFNS